MMKSLYQAANSLEAHMLSDLLQQEGIHAEILGEHLQSGAGELPAFDMVKLVVAENEYDRARAIISQWEKSQPRESAKTIIKYRGNFFIGAGIGLALGIGLTYLFFMQPISFNAIDRNADGKTDEKWSYAANGRPRLAEIDRNLDGRVDLIQHYDLDGNLASSRSDDNFDGVYESSSSYSLGNITITEIDSNQDGIIDLQYLYTHGILASIKFLNPETSLPLRVEFYSPHNLTHADVDTDKNGLLDTRIQYSELGEVISSKPVNSDSQVP